MPLLHGRSPARASGLERRVLLEGDVCRESAIATALVNRRWMVLHSPGAAAEAADGGATTSAPASLSSYRHKQDTEPSRTWPITKACSLDAIEHGTYRLREGQSTLYAVATARLGTTRQVDMVRVFVFVCVGGGGTGPTAAAAAVVARQTWSDALRATTLPPASATARCAVLLCAALWVRRAVCRREPAAVLRV